MVSPKNYVLLYEDQAVTPEFSQTTKQQLLAYISQLNEAIHASDKGNILDALYQVTSGYMQR
jgi:hypothetical protein